SVDWTDKNVTQQHTYLAGQATYTATLTASNAVGTSSPASKTIAVTTAGAPTASLSASPMTGTDPLTVTFNASGSSDNGSAITGLRLDFGPSGQFVTWTDQTQPQQFTYSAGQYTAL